MHDMQTGYEANVLKQDIHLLREGQEPADAAPAEAGTDRGNAPPCRRRGARKEAENVTEGQSFALELRSTLA
jgi:hypothetical protein